MLDLPCLHSTLFLREHCYQNTIIFYNTDYGTQVTLMHSKAVTYFEVIALIV
jgi:hypothetical protein